MWPSLTLILASSAFYRQYGEIPLIQCPTLPFALYRNRLENLVMVPPSIRRNIPNSIYLHLFNTSQLGQSSHLKRLFWAYPPPEPPFHYDHYFWSTGWLLANAYLVPSGIIKITSLLESICITVCRQSVPMIKSLISSGSFFFCPFEWEW
jgi:hypothetical protein